MFSGDVAGDGSGAQVVGLTGTVNAKQSTLAWWQVGGDASPTAWNLWSVQPRDSSKAPFVLRLSGAHFNSTYDSVLYYGYNADSANTNEPIARFNIEQDYEVTPGVHHFEIYWEFLSTDRNTNVRPFFASFDRSTGAASSIAMFGSVSGDTFSVQDKNSVSYYTQSSTLAAFANCTFSVNSTGALTVQSVATSSTPGANLQIQAQASTAATGAGGSLLLYSGQATGGASGTAGNILVNVWAPSGAGSEAGIYFQRSGTTLWEFDGGGFLFGANVGQVPVTPVGGGALFVQSGALKYKGSSGTVTTLANA